MKKIITAVAVAAALLLTGCGTISTEAGQATASATVSSSPTAAATATPQQLGSIIAEYESDWREYEANITDCALASIVGKGALDEIKALTCRTTSSTATMTGSIAARNIRKLDAPPASMKDLVSRTLVALDALGATGADKACAGDRKSDACDNAATLTNGAIRPVVSILDAWKPYTS